MGTKYPTQSISGFNVSPPPDDGSVSVANQLQWSKHIDKIGTPLKNLAEAINTALVDYVDVATVAKAINYTTTADDDRRVIECTASPDITLGSAASMGSGYAVTVKCVSGTTTVKTSDTIEGSASDRTLEATDSETYRVNEAADGYLLVSSDAANPTFGDITADSITMSAGGATIDEFSTDGTMADNSSTAVPVESAIVTYVAAQLTTKAYTTTANQTVNNTTTFVASATMPSIVLIANQKYRYDFCFSFTPQTATMGCKVQVVAIAGGLVAAGGYGATSLIIGTGTRYPVSGIWAGSATVACGMNVAPADTVSTSTHTGRCTGYFTTGGSGATLQLQFAQNTAIANVLSLTHGVSLQLTPIA